MPLPSRPIPNPPVPNRASPSGPTSPVPLPPRPISATASRLPDWMQDTFLVISVPAGFVLLIALLVSPMVVNGAWAFILVLLGSLAAGALGYVFARQQQRENAGGEFTRQGEATVRRIIRLRGNVDRLRVLVHTGEQRFIAASAGEEVEPLGSDFFTGLAQQTTSMDEGIADALAEWREYVAVDDIQRALQDPGSAAAAQPRGPTARPGARPVGTSM